MDRIHSIIDEGQARAIRFLRDLIAVRTENPPGERYGECVELMAEGFEALGLSCKTIDVPRAVARKELPHAARYPRKILLARWDAGAEETLHWNGHYDVVPAPGWSKDPFRLRQERGWLLGRGTADMKGAIAALWFACWAIRRAKVTPKVNLEASFVPDEEIGGALGTRYLVRSGQVRGDYAIVGEGGHRRLLGCGHNGAVWIETEILGKAAHTMYVDKGINAFERMVDVVREIQTLRDRAARRAFPTPAGTPSRPKINIGGVFAGGPGSSMNIVPAVARFTVDRRVPPGESVVDAERELRAAIREAARKRPDLRARPTILLRAASSIVDLDSPVAEEIRRAVRVVRGSPPRPFVAGAFTDMRFFVEKGIPSIQYGVGGRGHHAIDERIRVRDLLLTAKVYATALCEWGSARS